MNARESHQAESVAVSAVTSPRENAGRVFKREIHLWMMAILIMLGLTFAVQALDLFLWAERTSGHILSSAVWIPATIRTMLLVAVAGAALYFFKVALKLTGLNRTLIENLDSQTRLLAEKNAQLSRLKHLSENLISQVDLKPALDLALEMATDVIGARTASIMLLDPDGRELTIAAARGLPDKIVRTARVKVGEGLAGLVAKEGKSIVINSDDLDERLQPLAKRTREVHSAMITPIKIDGGVRGVINMSDKRGGERWAEEDVAVASTLAGQAAMVLQKIELYENLQKQVVMLEEALEELKKTQAELIQSEKLASIGQLAGGVAHEINNPLFVILGRAEFALDKLAEDHPAKKDLDIIHAQTERIAEIVRNLLSFARTSKVDDFKPINLNEVIENTLALAEHQMSKENIAVERDLDEGLPTVWGNPGQLQQVFVNIIINAHHAMAKSGGTLTVLTRPLRDRVLIRFSDTGPGIAFQDRDKIFEPFFTTKSETEGTGLGLAIGRGIIHAHGGKIEAGGEPGTGAVFTVELPTVKDTAPVTEVG